MREPVKWDERQSDPTFFMHIGQLIEQEVRRQRISVSWFAQQICCTRTHVYKIFQSPSIDTSHLYRISRTLGHNFFADLSQAYEDTKLPDI